MKILIKPIGVTSNEFINKLQYNQEISQKACYCGRLDPMARGNMLILENGECKNMKKYLSNKKIYEFEILFGFSTDTDDILGLINNINLNNNISKNLIKTKLEACLNIIQLRKIQKFHRYSSYMLRKGNERLPLWKWEKRKQLYNIDIPEKMVDIFNLDILDIKEYDSKKILKDFISKISIIDDKHKFRQQEIVTQWNNLLETNINTKISSVKISIDVSSGFYIRQLGYDLKTLLDFPLLIYDINRVDIF